MNEETLGDRAYRRSREFRSAFKVFLGLGIIGAIVLAVLGSAQTTATPGLFGTVDTSTTHDVGIGIGLFLAGLISTVLVTYPLLGLSYVMEGQANILDGQDDDDDEVAGTN